MKKLSPFWTRILKFFHLVFVSMWFVGVVAIVLIILLLDPNDGMQLYGINLALLIIDDFIIIPGAIGTVLTALIYAIFTHWGWFKFNWLKVKWGITALGMLLGALFLRPWLVEMVDISKDLGLDALDDSRYVLVQNLLTSMGIFQVVLILAAMYFAVLKPLSKKKEIK